MIPTLFPYRFASANLHVMEIKTHGNGLRQEPRDVLKGAGLRSTRQRVLLARLLFTGADRHVTAEMLHDEAREYGASISMGTIYNTLHQFTEAGLLREIVVSAGPSYFDTNTREHHHFYREDLGTLQDIDCADIDVSRIPELPEGTRVSRVDVVVRVTGDTDSD